MDQWVDDKEAAKILGFKNVQTLRNWRHLSRGPAYSKMGRSVRYRVSGKDWGSNLYPLLFKTIVKKAGEKISQE